MAVPLLSPVAAQSRSHPHEAVDRLIAPSMLNSRSSSYKSINSSSSSSPRGISPPGSSGSMATLAAEGGAQLLEKQRSTSRISLRPSYETLSMASNNGDLPTASSNPDSVAAQAVPVAAIGKVNVTDPWGTAWGMDSPYDASNAYSTNPNRITMRQSAYFGSALTLAALAGPPFPPTSSSSSSNVASTSNGQLHPHSATGSPAPSTFSSQTCSSTAGTNANVWSEASSTSSFNGGVIPPSAPWLNDLNKRRSVSFQGDLSQFNGVGSGVPSPTYSSDSHHSSSIGLPLHHSPHHHPHPQMPNLRARSTTHLPALLKQQQRHSTAIMNGHHNALPMNRRTTSTPGTNQDRNEFRKSFIGGSVVNHSNQSASLPPVPVDPKVLAKQSKKSSSSNLNGKNAGSASGNAASSRASIMTNATDRTDALSTVSGVEGGNNNNKKNKRKSWFARSPSSLGVVDTLPSSTSSSSNINNLNGVAQGKNNNTRRSTESLSATSHSSNSSGRPPALSRAGSSFNTFNGSPPPPTPPIPDVLPLPPSSLNDKSRKSSSNSLRNRINPSSGLNPGGLSSGVPIPSPSIVEMPPIHAPPASAASAPSPAGNNSQNLAVAGAAPPATPHGARISKAQTTPSIYGTPLASPTSNLGGHQASSTSVNTYGAPTSSSPLSMSPMTSPTSASSMPLKPAASARPSALQLPTHEEHSMQPDSFPSPGTHSESLSRDNGDTYNPPALPAVTMSLPPTPITEFGPGGPARNSLAPAAVIKASPSSPPALGSLAALADEERASLHMHSPTQTPTSTGTAIGAGRARICPAGIAAQAQRARSNSRPSTPLETQQRSASLQAMEAGMSAPSLSSRARSSSKGSLGQRSPPSTSPAASRKASNNSLRATVRQAPPSPEPSSAIVEHMPPGSPELDDQFLPIGRSESSERNSRAQQAAVDPVAAIAAPAVIVDKDNSAAPPHQPGLDMSLSSFAPRKAFPVNTGSSNGNGPITIAPLPRKSSAQSVLPETVPLPDSPALLQDGFANAQTMQNQMPLQPRGLAPQPHDVVDKTANAKQLKPRASSPNLQNVPQQKAHATKGQDAQLFPSKSSKGPDNSARKPSKSPFSLFKRTRSKTLGDGSPSPSEAAASQLYAPPPPMPIQKQAAANYESAVPTGSPPKPSSGQMTPAQTPQLSFSSSTTSTIAGSEPSDQFYADFAPDSRPSFSNHPSSSTKSNSTVSVTGNRDATLKKSAPASSKNHQQQQNKKMPLNSNSKSQNGATPSKGTFSRMFGASAKRKA